MLFTVADLQIEPIEFAATYQPGQIIYGQEEAGLRQTTPLKTEGRADLVEEHHGPKRIVSDIRVRGSYNSDFEVLCARCLEPVPQHIEGTFDLLYRPLGAQIHESADEHSITTSETEIGYYQKSGLELEDVLREQILLSLPARILCRTDCKGICPGCGQNLNLTACTCDKSTPDARWTKLADIGGLQKP
jgi:uncharacterized protein